MNKNSVHYADLVSPYGNDYDEIITTKDKHSLAELVEIYEILTGEKFITLFKYVFDVDGICSVDGEYNDDDLFDIQEYSKEYIEEMLKSDKKYDCEIAHYDGQFMCFGLFDDKGKCVGNFSAEYCSDVISKKNLEKVNEWLKSQGMQSMIW